LKELEDKISGVKSLEEFEKGLKLKFLGKREALASLFAKFERCSKSGEKRRLLRGLNEKKNYLQKLYDEVYKV